MCSLSSLDLGIKDMFCFFFHLIQKIGALVRYHIYCCAVPGKEEEVDAGEVGEAAEAGEAEEVP